MEKTLINHFEKVYIDQQSLSSDLAKRILMLFPKDKIEVVDSSFKLTLGELTAEQFSLSKRRLLVKNFAGQFFKRCPGASQKKVLTCCNYHILNLGQQCNMNCSYCYLQSYINNPTMMMYSNIESALSELRTMAETHGHQPFRVGTGEVIDSLSLDPISLFSRKLISFFKNYPKWTLEFKTKSNFVDQFLDCEHVGNVIVSWSINAPQIIKSEEHGTASLEDRIQAAKKCLKKGFQIAFHIDPMIWFQDWKAGYSELIEQLTSHFFAEEINVISLGALRFQPEQRHMMRERFGMNSYVTTAEMFPSEGNKLRYDQSLRKEMFDFVIQKFKNKNPNWRIFLCMETPETWLSSFEKTPMQVPELKDLFKPLPALKSQK